MKISIHMRSEEVASGRSVTSAQPRHATADLTPQPFSSARPHPSSRASTARTTGAAQEGLRCYPLSARFQTHEIFLGTQSANPRSTQ
jgi:hypothetical protein